MLGTMFVEIITHLSLPLLLLFVNKPLACPQLSCVRVAAKVQRPALGQRSSALLALGHCRAHATRCARLCAPVDLPRGALHYMLSSVDCKVLKQRGCALALAADKKLQGMQRIVKSGGTHC
jgi:hypothetical protein